MTTYADPTRCPDCRSPLPEAPQVCGRCALPLTGPTAIELFTTLQHADQLVAVLRRQAAPAQHPVPATVGASPQYPGSLLSEATPYPAARGGGTAAHRDAARDGSRLSGASVPRILLTLGALCLLVAAVTFLAVAWGWLGVGGRTVVLVGLTAVAFGVAGAFPRRGLRMAAEALTVVGLGLVALDVVGARHAGWLGEITDAGLVSTVGAVVATVALAMPVVTLPRPLVAPALLAPFAVLVAGVGAQVPVETPVPMLVATVVVLALGYVGNTLGCAPLCVSALVAGVLGWLYVVISGLGRAIDDDTVTHLWSHVAIWPLLAAVLVAAVAAPVIGLGRMATLVGYSVAAFVGTLVVVLPTLDNTLTDSTLSLFLCVLAWTAVAALAPAAWRPAAILPLTGAAVLPFVALLDLAGTAAQATIDVGTPFSQPFSVHVAASSTWVEPWLAAPILVALAAAGCALVGLGSPLRRTAWLVALACAATVGGLITLALYDAPLAAVVAVLVAMSAAGFAAAERVDASTASWLRSGATVPALLAVLSALPSDVMTTIVLGLATASCLYLMRRTDLTGDVACAAFTAAFGGLVWAAGEVASVPQVDRAVPILLVLGGMAVWRPDPVLETSAAIVGVIASVGAVAAAVDTPTALALHLTLAGALVTSSSLIHPTRRFLVWPGGLLLAMATWVRLADLGVTVPEAYTLPSALVLMAVGTWRLRREDGTPTVRLLAPGLSLATVPSVLVVLDDPAPLRALLLGMSCLALVLAGVALRWTAPLVVGSVVGGLLVLRELAPYAAQLPSWVVIGLSGTLLLVVGVTWESRMRDVRTTGRYVASLR